MQTKKIIVLFPGAWGNATEVLVRWWFRHVITFFKGYEVIVLTYPQGNHETISSQVSDCLRQLRGVQDGVYAICYSKGAQIARGVVHERPQLFRKVGLISGLERFGVRFAVLLKAMRIAFWPVVRVLYGGRFELASVDQIKRVFMNASNGLPESMVSQIAGNSKSEPCYATLLICMPLIRRHMPTFTCPVMAIVPDMDFFFPGVAIYPGERVELVHARGDHSLILHEDLLRSYIVRMQTWFQLP